MLSSRHFLSPAPIATASFRTTSTPSRPTAILTAAGRLLAIRIPRPQKRGESVDADLIHRRGKQVEGGGAGGGLLLEDGTAPGGGGSGGASTPAAPSSDPAATASASGVERWRVMPQTAKDFFRKVIKAEYVAAAGSGSGGGSTLAGIASGAVGLIMDVAAAGGPAADGDGGWASRSTPSTAIVAIGALSELPPEVDARLAFDPLAGRTRGLGKVFLEFSTVAGAVAAQRELSGRAFAGRVLVTAFVDEEAYRGGAACDFAACRGPPPVLGR
jgi:hypothetical protein